MGEVYKARDTRLDRVVALKVAKDQRNICVLFDKLLHSNNADLS
jgi:serine/threonine protein kinase